MDREGYFELPVNAELAPDYYDIVKNPMCFKQMSDKLDQHQYLAAKDFERDLDLLFSNVSLYNPVGHEVRKVAERLKLKAAPQFAILANLQSPEVIQHLQDRFSQLTREKLEGLLTFDPRLPQLTPPPSPQALKFKVKVPKAVQDFPTPEAAPARKRTRQSTANETPVSIPEPIAIPNGSVPTRAEKKRQRLAEEKAEQKKLKISLRSAASRFTSNVSVEIPPFVREADPNLAPEKIESTVNDPPIPSGKKGESD